MSNLEKFLHLLIGLIFAVSVSWTLGSLIIDTYIKDLAQLKHGDDDYKKYYWVHRSWYLIAIISTFVVGLLIPNNLFNVINFFGLMATICWAGWAVTCGWHLWTRLKVNSHCTEFILTAISTTVVITFLIMTTLERVLVFFPHSFTTTTLNSNLQEVLQNIAYVIVGIAFAAAISWGLSAYIFDQYIEMLFGLRNNHRSCIGQYYKNNRLWFHIPIGLGLIFGYFVIHFGSPNLFVLFTIVLTTIGWLGWFVNNGAYLENCLGEKFTAHRWEFVASTLSLWLLSMYAASSIISSLFQQLDLMFL